MPSLLFLDLFWTRALQGEALPAVQAALLRLDPAVTVGVPALSVAVRRSVALRTVIGGVAITALALPLFFALWYYQIWILQRINQALRIELLDRLQALSLRFHSEARVGDAIYRLTQDSAMVTQLVDVLLLTPLSAIGTFLFAFAITAALDPRMALLLAAAWLPALALARAFSSPLRRDFRRARETNAALTAQIQEIVAGIRVLKAYGAEARAQTRFETASRDAFDAAFRARSRFAIYAIALFAGVGTVLVAGAAWGAFAVAASRRRCSPRACSRPPASSPGASASSSSSRTASATARTRCAGSSAPGRACRTSRSDSTASSRCSTSEPEVRDAADARRSRRRATRRSRSATSRSTTARTARRSRTSRSKRRSARSPRSSVRPARARAR